MRMYVWFWPALTSSDVVALNGYRGGIALDLLLYLSLPPLFSTLVNLSNVLNTPPVILVGMAEGASQPSAKHVLLLIT